MKSKIKPNYFLKKNLHTCNAKVQVSEQLEKLL